MRQHPEIHYKGRMIHPNAYERGARWLPAAFVITITSTGTHGHSVTGEEEFVTEAAANAEAVQLAKAWVDEQDMAADSDVR